jgi:hypothetical protein
MIRQEYGYVEDVDKGEFKSRYRKRIRVRAFVSPFVTYLWSIVVDIPTSL